MGESIQRYDILEETVYPYYYVRDVANEDTVIDIANAHMSKRLVLQEEANQLLTQQSRLDKVIDPTSMRKERKTRGERWEKFLIFYSWFRANELIRYARWAIIILITTAIIQTIVEWDTFSASLAAQIGADDVTRMQTFFHAFWWSVVTFTTVGYGDVSPTTALGKSIAILMMLVNLGLVTVLSGTIASVLVARRLQGGKELNPDKYKGHLVILGWNESVRDILQGIAENKPDNNLVILVNEEEEDVVNRMVSEFKDLDVTHIEGNFTEEAILRSAFIAASRMCLIVPDESKLQPGKAPDEQRTILATLTAKGISEDLVVVAHVLSESTVPHLKRANANDVVYVDPHAPYLMANHATRPGVPQLLDHILENDKNEHKLSVVDVPSELVGQTHDLVSAYFRSTNQWIVLGYTFLQAGFDLEKQMAESGSPVIRAMIKEQLEEVGAKLSLDEKIAVSVNPKDDFVVASGYKAVILT